MHQRCFCLRCQRNDACATEGGGGGRCMNNSGHTQLQRAESTCSMSALKLAHSAREEERSACEAL